MKGVAMRPQEFFRPRHLVMPLEGAVELLGITSEELLRLIKSGESTQLVLVELPGGQYVEFVVKEDIQE